MVDYCSQIPLANCKIQLPMGGDEEESNIMQLEYNCTIVIPLAK